MSTCDRVRPLLARMVDSEVDPGEAIEVGHHLPDCTACRILLARERRLSHLLEREWPDQPLGGDTFVDAVMATLPHGPPPPRRSVRHRLRVVEVGCLTALGFAASLAAHAAASLAVGPSPFNAAGGDGLERAAFLVESALTLGQRLAAGIDLAAGAAALLREATTTLPSGAAQLGLPAALAALLCGGALLALATPLAWLSGTRAQRLERAARPASGISEAGTMRGAWPTLPA